MILRVYQFLIICQDERFFRNHMISTDHHSGNGNNCFLVSAPLFDMPIFDSKVWLLPAFDCDKGALHHHWFDVMTCFFAPDRFFLASRFIVCKVTPGTKEFGIIKNIHVNACCSKDNGRIQFCHARQDAFTDANGHQETYTYDSGFWESTVFTTASGSEYLHQFDSAGRCVAIEDADGESTYAYTCYDLLGMETDPLGHTTRYLYDNVSDLTGMVRPNQHTLNMSEEKMETYKNDAFHRRISRTDCTGAVLEYHYDANNRRIFEKRRISGTVEQIFRYLYDAGGRLIELNRTADKEGCGRQSVSVRYEYDKNGNNTKTILPTGAQILREYDAADRLVLERHVDKTCGIDNTTQFSYDKAGNLISIIDNQGRSTQITYDLMNREIKRTERDGSVTRQFYDSDGQLIKVIRPKEYARAGENGKGVQYTYDAQGRVLTVIRADGIIQESNTYDIEGNLIHTQDATGNGIDMEYDLGGRRTKIATKGKASQRYLYDVFGNITGITDGEGNHTKYILDKWGRIVEIRQSDGNSEYYSYDFAGNITCAIDAAGNTTTYEYSGINQLTVMTDPTGEQEHYHYDEQDRLCRKIDRNGTKTTYAYNIYGNLTERRARKTDGTELSECYEYTPEGFLKSAISQGMHYSYAYDTMGRLTEKKASGRRLLSFQYDLNGNLTHQTDVTGKRTEYRYDLADNIREVWDNGKKIAEYEYNADNTIKYLKNGSLYTEYAYDADRNLIGLKTLLGTDTIVDNRYTYNGNGDRLEKYQKCGTTKYSYDKMRRLAKVEYPNATEELFYDKAGNRTKRLYNGTEELYQYDKRNRLTAYTKGGMTSQYKYDNAGNLLKDDKARYAYDVFNRNTKVETFNGNIQINRYDAEGLRHEMEENGKLVSFIYRGDEVIAEESQEDRIRYIRTSVLLASDAESARTYYHYASDEMSSVTHVVDSENEEILNHYEYDAWGNLTVCEEKVQNRFKFNSQQYDPISQQYYLRARYYNPVIGRFTQEDSYNVDGLNLYAYCRNNPVSYVDPSGSICKTAADAIIDKMKNNKATRNEQKKLAAYLRNKARHKRLEDWESDILLTIDGYTNLSRYVNQGDSNNNQGGSNPAGTPIYTGNAMPWKNGATPNSIYEQLNPDGTVKSRAFYNQNGQQINRQDFDHPHYVKKLQQYCQPHEHIYIYNNGYRVGEDDGPLTPGYNNQPT